jgi:hypothetical protein
VKTKSLKIVAILPSIFCLSFLPARAALVSGVYQTLPGAVVTESGDRVPNGSRIVPISATLTIDVNSAEPSLSAVITNAVLEGGTPFLLTLHSSSAAKLPSGAYRFQGDYLGEMYLSGTQYEFDYQFSASTNGQIVWDGHDYWAGGHLWFVTITNITLVPVPWLYIAQTTPTSFQISWGTNFADHVLESTGFLQSTAWDRVTNAPAKVGERLSVTVDMDGPSRFYRLVSR